ncbi:MAG: hydroxymethylglutaryl-CoA synthase [Candidatus Bathyarchaeia archaeon]
MPVGIVSFGEYIPPYRLKSTEVARVWCRSNDHVKVEEISVPYLDEDAVTIAVETARFALKRCKVNPQDIGAIHLGSESRPYAVKSCSAIVAQAIGASPYITAADYEFACKAGTEAIQTCMGLVGSGMIKYGLAIGVDTAQAAPSDELEFTCGAGGAAFLVGPRTDDTIAYIEGSASYVTDTPDFWRRSLQPYPSHAMRFTGDPAYFAHTIPAARLLMEKLQRKPEDFNYAVFHQPNAKFPVKAGLMLGFSKKQLEPGLLSPVMGNAYAGSSLLGLAATMEMAQVGDRILIVSYGSGSGSDAFSIVVERKPDSLKRAPTVSHMLARKHYVDYAEYTRYRNKLLM